MPKQSRYLRPKFYCVSYYNLAQQDFVIAGIFTGEADANDCKVELLSEPATREGITTQFLAMDDIKTLLVKERLMENLIKKKGRITMLDRMKTAGATFLICLLMLLLLSWQAGRDERERKAHQCSCAEAR
jgi:hypothetical protein